MKARAVAAWVLYDAMWIAYALTAYAVVRAVAC